MSVSAPVSATRFREWWLGELRDIFAPPALGQQSPPQNCIVVRIAASSHSVWLAKAVEQTEVATFAPDAPGIGLCVRELLRAHPTFAIGISISKSRCLVRRAVVPVQARRDAERLLILDLEATTPLRAGDVYSAVTIDPCVAAKPGQVAFVHLVAKRSTIELAKSTLGRSGASISFVTAHDDESGDPLPLIFSASDRHMPELRSAGSRRVSALILALCLAATVPLIWFDRQETEIARISTLADIAQQKAAATRRQREAQDLHASRLDHLHASHLADLQRLRAIETLSRLLPETTWLTDMSIEANRIVISGYTTTAAALVGLIDSSPAFHKAELVAPVMFDTTEQKERFSLAFSLVGDVLSSSVPPPSMRDKSHHSLVLDSNWQLR